MGSAANCSEYRSDNIVTNGARSMNSGELTPISELEFEYGEGGGSVIPGLKFMDKTAANIAPGRCKSLPVHKFRVSLWEKGMLNERKKHERRAARTFSAPSVKSVIQLPQWQWIRRSPFSNYSAF